jgi:hypothetical protein
MNKPLRNVRFALYANTRGFYYFAEIQRLLACGLKELGAQVVESSQSRGFDPKASWHIIVAPHEFFYVGAGAGMRRGPWPPGVIFYNLEPLDSQWFPLVRRILPRAHAVWDMDLRSSKLLSGESWRSSHVPPGWVDACDLFRPVRTIPDLALTRSIPPEARRRPSAFEKRPIGLFFIGARSERRASFFASADPLVSRFRRFIRLVDDEPFVRPGARAPLYTQALLGLVQRSKIVLNIHRRPHRYFEWHRMALHGIAQGALVLSEPASPAPPFIPGKDFVAATLKEMPEAIEYYLSSEQGRSEAKRIAAHGLRTYRESCRLSGMLRRAVDALDAPNTREGLRAKIRAETARELLDGIKIP